MDTAAVLRYYLNWTLNLYWYVCNSVTFMKAANLSESMWFVLVNETMADSSHSVMGDRSTIYRSDCLLMCADNQTCQAVVTTDREWSDTCRHIPWRVKNHINRGRIKILWKYFAETTHCSTAHSMAEIRTPDSLKWCGKIWGKCADRNEWNKENPMTTLRIT